MDDEQHGRRSVSSPQVRLYLVDTAREGVLEAELFEDQILRMHAVLIKKDYTYLWWRSWMWQCLSVKASKFRHITTWAPSRVIEIVIAILILSNASFAFFLLIDSETYDSGEFRKIYRYAVQVPSAFLFLLEYLARLWSCVESARYGNDPFWGRLFWAIQPLSLFDFACIIVVVAPTGKILRGHDTSDDMITWMSLRLLLLLRFERQIKVFKRMYQLFGTKIEELCLSAYFTAVCVLSFGVAFYALEHDKNENITTLWNALYWSVITITTVGYGDTTPRTNLGCVLAGALSFMGFLVFAIPTGIISSTFMILIEKNRTKIRKIANRLRGFVVIGETEGKTLLSGEEEEEEEKEEETKNKVEIDNGNNSKNWRDSREWKDVSRDVVGTAVCTQCEKEAKRENNNTGGNIICGHKESIITTTRKYLLEVEHEIEIAESKMREIHSLVLGLNETI
jgi:voltage-gated potassium channel